MVLNNLHAFAASVARGGRGWIVQSPAREPEQRLELYEFESCPFCRKAREAMSELDLSYINRTCPRGSANRAKVVEMGGKALFPFLVDPNTDTQMYESEDIITYLADTYGDGRSTLGRALSPINTLSAAVASAVRPFGGKAASARSAQPDHLLELYNFEASPYCRKVREAFGALDLDYVVHNVAKNGRHRPDLVARGGKMMVPYLIDANTDTEMYESDDIVAYLHATYGA